MIVLAHLLNDRTGSPRVLKAVIESLPDDEPPLLYIGSDGDGVLSKTGAPVRKYWYRRTTIPLLTLGAYFISQALLFGALLRDRSIPKNAVIYANTLLPFGAALYGRLTGRPVVYHVHEVSLSPRLFRQLLVGIAKATSDRLIYVSRTHLDLLPIATDRSVVIHNAVDADLEGPAMMHRYSPRDRGAFTVLMLASARAYKGLGEFEALAGTLAHRRDIAFELVLSDLPAAANRSYGPNVTLLPSTDTPATYYARASLVLNLSRPDQWVETFGLTLLEAMAFGIPVIAPPVGGPTELITHGSEGFLIDSRDLPALTAAVLSLVDDEGLSKRMSEAARETSERFNREAFGASIMEVIKSAREARGFGRQSGANETRAR